MKCTKYQLQYHNSDSAAAPSYARHIRPLALAGSQPVAIFRSVHFLIMDYNLFFIYCSVHHNILWNNQQMQLYAVNFIPLLSSHYMFRARHTPIIRITDPHSYFLPVRPGTDSVPGHTGRK